MLLVLLRAHSALWAFWRLVRGPRALRGTPGLMFAKVLGSGRGGGFGLAPSGTHGGLFCAFDSAESAQLFARTSAAIAAYRRHTQELATLLLRPCSSRGAWAGHRLVAHGPVPAPNEPVAALTRASIAPARAFDFWRYAPAAQRAVETAAGCRVAAGLGEAPLLRQATFSLWDSAAAMDAYARQGAHAQAIRAAAQGGHFSESMFVRFAVLEAQGRWQGKALG